MIAGPLQYLVIGFEGNRFSGEIVAELEALRKQGIARVVDLVLIKRDQQGHITEQELSDLSPEEAEPFRPFAHDLLGLFTEEDVAALAEEIPNNCAAAICLLEYMWATRLRDAIRRANGVVFNEGLVPMATVQDLAAELNAVPSGSSAEAYAQ